MVEPKRKCTDLRAPHVHPQPARLELPVSRIPHDTQLYEASSTRVVGIEAFARGINQKQLPKRWCLELVHLNKCPNEACPP